MKHFLKYITTVTAILGIVSCQREIDGGPNEIIQEDNIYLEKLVETDTTYSSGLDTSIITIYTYDASKRLVRKDETIFTEGTHTIEGTISVKRFYNGSDTLPYKLTSEEQYATGEYYADTMFLFYNAANLIIKDSMLVYNATNIIAKNRMMLTPAGTNRFYVREDYFNPVTANTIWMSDSVFTGFTYNGGNLMTCYDSVYSVPSGALNYTSTHNYNYDNKANPFRNMVLPYPAHSPFVDLGLESSTPYHVSANNSSSMTLSFWSTGGSQSHIHQVLYEYTTEGYPKIVRYSSVTDPSKSKNYFFYRTF